MKKKILLVILSVFVSIIIVAMVVSCSDIMDKYEDNISELRTDIYKHSNDLMSIIIMSGKREQNFAVDGKTNKTIDFTIITIVPANKNEGTSYDYSIQLGQQEYKGTMIKHPFNESYSVELEKATDRQNLLLNLSSTDGYKDSFELHTEYKSNMIDYDRALEIAIKRLKDKFDNLTSNKKLNAEIFIRFIDNPLDSTGGYYWYVALVDTNSNTYAVLIDPINEKVLAARE